MIFFVIVAVFVFGLTWIGINAYFCNMAFDAEEARNAEDKAIKAQIKRDSHQFRSAYTPVPFDHCIGKKFQYPPVTGRRF